MRYDLRLYEGKSDMCFIVEVDGETETEHGPFINVFKANDWIRRRKRELIANKQGTET